MVSRAGVLLCIAIALAGCGLGPRQEAPAAAASNEIGLEVLAVELMAGGDLARLNYRVVDVERARRTLQGEVFLRAGEEGPLLKVISAGRLGQMRQRPASGNKRQFILFTNAGRTLDRGKTAILYVGATPIARVTVT